MSFSTFRFQRWRFIMLWALAGCLGQVLLPPCSINVRQKKLRRVGLVGRGWNYGIGHYIVEFEQGGTKRAEYGKGLLKRLSERLTERYGKGWSVDTLEKTRTFYNTYSISATVQRKSEKEKSTCSWICRVKAWRIIFRNRPRKCYNQQTTAVPARNGQRFPVWSPTEKVHKRKTIHSWNWHFQKTQTYMHSNMHYVCLTKRLLGENWPNGLTNTSSFMRPCK